MGYHQLLNDANGNTLSDAQGPQGGPPLHYH